MHRLRAEGWLDCETQSVGEARRFVEAALAVWDLDDRDEVARLLTSEVTTNAVVHARTGFHIAVAFGGGELIVEVSDGSRQLPTRRDPPPDEPSGRGLLLLDHYAKRWGCERHADGKTVWFALQLTGRPSRTTQELPVGV